MPHGDRQRRASQSRLRRSSWAAATLLAGACVGLALGTGCFREAIGEIPSDPEELREELFKAAKYHGPRRTRALIEAGAVAGTRDLLGWTPLHYAVNRWRARDYRDPAIIAALIEADGVEVNSVANDGSVPITLAVRHGAIEVLDLLLDHGARFDQRTDTDMTLLMLAVQNGRAEMAAHLIDLGVEIDERLPGGGTALFIAVQRQVPSLVRLLIERGAEVDGSELVAAPIVFAAALPSQEIVASLLAAGADVNAVNQANGMTALHRGVTSGASMIGLLLEAGARREVVNADGLTPLDLARGLGDPERIGLLTAGL